jgi:hypothetical protein
MLDQELAHVELAWSFVAWAHARGDADLRAAVRSAFAETWRWIPRGADVEPAPQDADRWRAAGRLPQSDRLAIAERALVEVVGPLATTLLRGDVLAQADAHTT